MYTCDQCPKSSKSKQSIINHKHLHIEGPFRCDMCDKSFSLKSTLTNHLCSSKKHKSNPYTCSQKGCQYNSFSWSMISEHTKFGHLKQKLFVCTKCDKPYQTPSKLSAHVNIKHEKKSDDERSWPIFLIK